ncbi:hypothetical protein HMPREF9123_0039 [Neisseria bacilliformis ATCC BAA-1200]|uniref:Uncharacterized protein n=1 Tax=Neisseria bacilliformis ATCC BAA-1200 TaxID=888742 RepID=F2B8L9_9NEIS|nr:hypothetical protein HMPREF9123_0039 [Neisseria bacilliformis ATCC BAA-1200]
MAFALKSFFLYPFGLFPLPLGLLKKSGMRALSIPLFGFWIIALTLALLR